MTRTRSFIRLAAFTSHLTCTTTISSVTALGIAYPSKSVSARNLEYRDRGGTLVLRGNQFSKEEAAE